MGDFGWDVFTDAGTAFRYERADVTETDEEEIRYLGDGHQEAGPKQVTWEPSSCPSGQASIRGISWSTASRRQHKRGEDQGPRRALFCSVFYCPL